MLTNTGKLSLDKGIAIFVSAFFPKLHGQEPKDSPDLIILDIWSLLSFISVDILLEKAFLILVFYLAVRTNSCGNSLSSNFLFFNLNIVPVLFFCCRF